MAGRGRGAFLLREVRRIRRIPRDHGASRSAHSSRARSTTRPHPFRRASRRLGGPSRHRGYREVAHSRVPSVPLRTVSLRPPPTRTNSTPTCWTLLSPEARAHHATTPPGAAARACRHAGLAMGDGRAAERGRVLAGVRVLVTAPDDATRSDLPWPGDQPAIQVGAGGPRPRVVWPHTVRSGPWRAGRSCPGREWSWAGRR
jgi:hypothetical protein